MITLKTVLRTNAASCIIFGIIFLLAPSQVSTFLGGAKASPAMVFLLVGGGLFANGLHLLWGSLKALPSKALIIYFSLGDAIWVIASIGFLVLGVGITTAAGSLATVLVAMLVGALGVLQIVKRKEMGNCEG